MAEVLNFVQERIQRAISHDEEILEAQSSGWHVVGMKSRKCIETDARLLNHDFDDVKLINRLASGNWMYASIRSPSGERKVTLEISRDEEIVVEIASSSEIKPQSEALRVASSYAAREGFGVINRWSSGFLFTRDGEVRDVRDHLDTVNLRGDLLIERCENVAMPRKLTVSDALFIKDSTIVDAPVFLSAKAMHVVQSAMPKLGEYVVINGDCGITDNSRIPQLADTLVTRGCLHIDEFTPIEHMPRKLRIGTFLNANDVNIDSLGSDVRINGSLNVAGSPLAQRVFLDAQGRPVYSGEFVEISNPPMRDVRHLRIPRYSRGSSVVGRFICSVGTGAGVVLMHPDYHTFHFAVIRSQEMVAVNVPDQITALFPDWLPDDYRSE